MVSENKSASRLGFQRIFVERIALSHPATVSILAQHSQSHIILIDHYKDVFNRPRQDWRMQKQNPALILAIRREEFIYDASAYTPDFGHSRFYYNALALNCVFDCSYCYLQGMFPSAYTTLFVNNEDYFEATDVALQKGPIYLALSYDTDLLALEHLFPYTRKWLDYARERPDLTIELRTKSIRYKLLRDVEPLDRFILAWTLSPQPVIERYEARTPSLKARLRSIKEAVQDGWEVRVCIDPILNTEDWETIYSEFADILLEELKGYPLKDFCLGVFRMNRDYLKNLKKRAKITDLLHYPYTKKNGVATYPLSIKQNMMGILESKLSKRPEPIIQVNT